MPAIDNEDDYLHHHHDIINPNPNSRPNPSIPGAVVEYPRSAAPLLPKPSPKFLSLFLKAVIMILIISLFFLFLGIAAVVVLHFFLPGGAVHRLRRRSAQSRLPTAPANAAYSAEDLQRFLPRLKYVAGLPETECAVCLDRFEEGKWCRSLPECHHLFHASCVDRWLTKVPNCPICRTRVRLNLEDSGSVTRGDDWKQYHYQ